MATACNVKLSYPEALMYNYLDVFVFELGACNIYFGLYFGGGARRAGAMLGAGRERIFFSRYSAPF